MEQNKPAAKRGRPVTRKETEAPKKAAPKKAATKKPSIKRNIPDRNRLPKMYEMAGKKGGLFYKVRSNNLVIYDEETTTNRRIRYCPGEASIYVDEQSDAAVKEHVVFRNKMLIVPYDKPNLLAFLEKHPDNQANGGGSFRLVNKEIDIEKEVENEFLVTDAISMIKARPIDDLLPVALSLNINTNQNDLSIKRSLVMYAKKNPQKFMDMFDNPVVHARTMVMQGFDFQIITDKNGAVVWTDTGKIILSIPVGQDRIDTVTRFCMTDKGSSVLSEIERQLNEIA